MQRAAPCANQCEAQAFKIEIRQLEYQLAEAQEVIRLQVENYDELKEQSDAQHGYFNSVITERDALQSQLEELRFARSPHAKTPILYTDEIGGKQCCRDDLWAIGTAELNELAALRAQEPVNQMMLDALKEARDALGPFADDASGIHKDWSCERRRNSLTQDVPLKVGDFRKAGSARDKAIAAIESARDSQWLKMLGDGEAVAWGMPDHAGNIVETIMPIDKQTDMKMWADQYKVPLFTHPAPDHTALLRQALEALEAFKLPEESIVGAQAGNLILRVPMQTVQKQAAAHAAIREALNVQSK